MEVPLDLGFVQGLELVLNDDALGQGLCLIESEAGLKQREARHDENEAVFRVHRELEDHGQVEEDV